MHECIQELSIVFLQLNWRNLVLLTCYMTYTLMSLWNVVATIFARWSAYLLLQKRCEVIGYECSWGKHIFILFFFFEVEALPLWLVFDFPFARLLSGLAYDSQDAGGVACPPWSGLYCDLGAVVCQSYCWPPLPFASEISYVSFLFVHGTRGIKVQLRLLDYMRPGDTKQIFAWKNGLKK